MFSRFVSSQRLNYVKQLLNILPSEICIELKPLCVIISFESILVNVLSLKHHDNHCRSVIYS